MISPIMLHHNAFDEPSVVINLIANSEESHATKLSLGCNHSTLSTVTVYDQDKFLTSHRGTTRPQILTSKGVLNNYDDLCKK